VRETHNPQKKDINMVKLESSAVSGVGYDHINQILTVKFTSGKKYDYKDVPVQVYEDLVNAPSSGKFLNKEVKGKYQTA